MKNMFTTEAEKSMNQSRHNSLIMDPAETEFADWQGSLGFVERMQGITLDRITTVRLMNRIDTKYLLPVSRLGTVVDQVIPYYYIQEIDGNRMASYNTVYYDSPGLQFFNNHVNGKLNRCKVRRRSYVESNLHFLEVKSKTNKGKTIKNRIQLKNTGGNFSDEAYHMVEKYAGTDLFLLFPILENYFKRITLVNLEMTERVTIDFNLSFNKPGNNRDFPLSGLVIIEIKQDKFNVSPIRSVLFNERIRGSGISKYCLGVALTEPKAKTNVMKKKIRKIEKITHYEFNA